MFSVCSQGGGAGYIPKVPTLPARSDGGGHTPRYLPTTVGMPLAFTQEDFLVWLLKTTIDLNIASLRTDEGSRVVLDAPENRITMSMNRFFSPKSLALKNLVRTLIYDNFLSIFFTPYKWPPVILPHLFPMIPSLPRPFQILQCNVGTSLWETSTLFCHNCNLQPQ